MNAPEKRECRCEVAASGALRIFCCSSSVPSSDGLRSLRSFCVCDAEAAAAATSPSLAGAAAAVAAAGGVRGGFCVGGSAKSFAGDWARRTEWKISSSVRFQ